MRPVKVEGRDAMVRDGSSFAYQIEELVALGAVDIALTSCPMHHAFREELSPTLRKRVQLIDPDSECDRQAVALMSPIAEELSLQLEQGAVGFDRSLESEVQHAVSTLYFDLCPFLRGAAHELQIDIDLDKLQSSIALLRQKLRNPRSRAFLSVFEGILGTYKTTSIAGVALRSAAPDRLIALFEEFVQDETYCLLSEQSHKLGFPKRAARAATLVGRYAKRMLDKPVVQKVADLSSKGVTMATQVPLPDSETCAALMPSEFLPPIISLRKALESAHDLWVTQRPDLLLPPGTGDRWRGQEIVDAFDDDSDEAQQPPERDK